MDDNPVKSNGENDNNIYSPITFKQKTIDFLLHAEVGFEDMEKRIKSLENLESKYKLKEILSKMYELSDRGYTEFGGNPIGSWLTEKGKEILFKYREGQIKII
jgi:hypothetical protein